VDGLVRATGLRTAVLHSEWIVDAGGVPHLVECAARLPGDGIHDLIDRAYDIDVVGAWLGLMVDGELPEPVAARQAAAVGFVGVHVDAETAATVLDAVRAAEGVRDADLKASSPGDGPVRESSDRTGSVVVEAPTPERAALLMESAVGVAERVGA
jgi:hypothetical protein